MTKENQVNQGKCYSDEFLNAFVDDQLAAEEKGRAYLKIAQDETLNRQVCELRKMHELVQLAYRHPPEAPPQKINEPKRSRIRLRSSVAATLVLGLLIGSQIDLLRPSQAPLTVASAPAKVRPSSTAPALNRAPATQVQAASAQPVSLHVAKPLSNDRTAYGTLANKVLIHIANDDDVQIGQALDEIESLLQYYRTSGQNARVEVVINGKGLQLVRADTTAHGPRIHSLQREFDNLTFAACQNSIDRLKREQGIHVRLLPGVVVIDSGMAELMRRQNQGWTYLQV